MAEMKGRGRLDVKEMKVVTIEEKDRSLSPNTRRRRSQEIMTSPVNNNRRTSEVTETKKADLTRDESGNKR